MCGVYMADETATVERVTHTRRFFGSWLEGILFFLTLIVGWYIWLFFTAQTAQTPAKRLLNVYIVDVNTGQPVSAGKVWLREFVIKGLLFGWVGGILFYVPTLLNPLWILFDKDRQALHDKMASTVVVYAPLGLPEGMQAPAIAAGAAYGARAPSVADTGEQLRELARLRDEGIITPEEYEQKRADLAGKL